MEGKAWLGQTVQDEERSRPRTHAILMNYGVNGTSRVQRVTSNSLGSASSPCTNHVLMHLSKRHDIKVSYHVLNSHPYRCFLMDPCRCEEATSPLGSLDLPDDHREPLDAAPGSSSASSSGGDLPLLSLDMRNTT